MDLVYGRFLKHDVGHKILTRFWVDKTDDCLPEPMVSIKLLSLKIGFVNLVFFGFKIFKSKAAFYVALTLSGR
jgi:hypothetical protein